MNTNKIIYWISTAMMCIIFLYSASMYFMNTEMIKGYFTAMQYPSYIVIPLAVAKVLGVIAVLTRKVDFLTEWAYAGFLIDAILAFSAHIHAQDGGYVMSLVAGIATLVSYFLGRKLFQESKV